MLIHKRISLDYSLTRRLELSNTNVVSKDRDEWRDAQQAKHLKFPNRMRNAVAVNPVARMLWKVTDQEYGT